jgi:hypothetical protein
MIESSHPPDFNPAEAEAAQPPPDHSEPAAHASLDPKEIITTRPLAEIELQTPNTLPSMPTPVARLRVIRGQRLNLEFPLYEGQNLIGRADEQPVDVDVTGLEPADRTWTSRQHAIISVVQGGLTIEDLKSTNGTFVNRQRVKPDQAAALRGGDVVQIGTIQFKLIL